MNCIVILKDQVITKRCDGPLGKGASGGPWIICVCVCVCVVDEGGARHISFTITITLGIS